MLTSTVPLYEIYFAMYKSWSIQYKAVTSGLAPITEWNDVSLNTMYSSPSPFSEPNSYLKRNLPSSVVLASLLHRPAAPIPEITQEREEQREAREMDYQSNTKKDPSQRAIFHFENVKR